jgi:phosphatidylserine/phosphatidylglycerophosphate/cardiolipin synthase-like enzyme
MDLINNAKTSLLVAAMYVKDDQVRGAIAARKAAGLDVRVLLPDPAWISDAPMDAAYFQSVGVPVKYFKQYDLHAKLIIADDVAFIGSENYSYTSLTNNREAGVFITDQVPMSKTKMQFETDWNVGFVAP